MILSFEIVEPRYVQAATATSPEIFLEIVDVAFTVSSGSGLSPGMSSVPVAVAQSLMCAE